MKGWRIVAFSAVVAATAPITAAVHGWISKSKELAIAERKQDFDMRMAFLDRAIDPNRALDDRQQVLRFLSSVVSDASLKAWAEAELKRVNVQIEERSQLEEKLSVARQERDQARRERDQAELGHRVASEQESAAKARLAQSSRENSMRLQALQREVSSAAVKTEEAKQRIQRADDKTREAERQVSQLRRATHVQPEFSSADSVYDVVLADPKPSMASKYCHSGVRSSSGSWSPTCLYGEAREISLSRETHLLQWKAKDGSCLCEASADAFDVF